MNPPFQTEKPCQNAIVMPRLEKRRAAEATTGFTLIELLIVIAIIAILAMLLFSVGGKLNSNAKAVGCAQNLRQIWTCLRLFANDNNGRLPGPSYQGVTISAPSVPSKLLAYSGGSDLIWDCPARPKLRNLRGYTGYLQGSAYDETGRYKPVFGYPAGAYPEKASVTFLEMSQSAKPEACWLLSDMDVKNYQTPGLDQVAPGPAHNGARNILFHDGLVVLKKEMP